MQYMEAFAGVNMLPRTTDFTFLSVSVAKCGDTNLRNTEVARKGRFIAPRMNTPMLRYLSLLVKVIPDIVQSNQTYVFYVDTTRFCALVCLKSQSALQDVVNVWMGL